MKKMTRKQCVRGYCLEHHLPFEPVWEIILDQFNGEVSLDTLDAAADEYRVSGWDTYELEYLTDAYGGLSPWPGML